MRKKFLKSAAAFSIAAACIMGGLAPATVGLPVEVAAAALNPDDSGVDESTVQGWLNSIITSYIKQTKQVSSDGKTIDLKAKSFEFGTAIDSCDVGENTLDGVTITIESVDKSDGKLQISADGKSVVLKNDDDPLTSQNISGETVTIKASVAKTDATGGKVEVTSNPIALTFEDTTSDTPDTPDTPLGKAGIASVNVNGGRGTMDITGADGTQEILVGIGKVNKGKKTITVPSWATYEAEETTVDLSKLSNVKDNYIVLSTPGKDVVIVKIPASHKSIKAKYSVKDGLQVGTSATGGASAAALTSETVGLYQYRTAYSGWNDLELADGKVDLSLYQEEGAKLFVRMKVAGEATPKVDTTESWTYGSQKDVAVLKACTLPGKETKVSIPAKAKGPKVTADYAKGTVKFPKNSEFRLASTTDIYDDNGKAFGSPTDKVTVAKVYETAKVPAGNQPAEIDIEVRTKETDKKPASKWGRLTIALPAGFATGAITEGDRDVEVKAEDVKKDEVKEFGGKGVKDSTLKETENGSSVLKMEYAGTAKNPTLKITNSGENAYEFVKEAKGAEKPGDSAKAVKAAKGKTITIKGIKDEDVIFVRVAGDKKKQDWVGAYAKLGSVDVPKKVTGTKTDGATPSPTPTTAPVDPVTRKVTDTDLGDFADAMLKTELTLPTNNASTTEAISLAQNEAKPVAIGGSGNEYTAEDTKEITGIIVSVSVAGDTTPIFNTDTSNGLKYANAMPGLMYSNLNETQKESLVVTITISHADVENPITRTLTLK